MTAPMLRGADAGTVLRWLQCQFGSRLYRQPVQEMAIEGVSSDDLTRGRLALIRSLGWSAGHCDRVLLALGALENYYLAIGASWDASRIGWQRFDLELVRQSTYRDEEMRGLHPMGCRFEGYCDAESHAMGLAWENALQRAGA
jgi:hypothetical protein